MKRGRGGISELCYAAEGMSGSAAASSLRKLGSLMEQAPTGRLFDAISTLSDMSAKAAQALEDGSQALAGSAEADAAARMVEALGHMDAMTRLPEPARKTPKRRAAR